MNPAPSTRGKARNVLFVTVALAVLGVAVACQQTSRANGEACIKDQDCLSNFCLNNACAPTGVTFDAEVQADGTAATEAAAESGADAAPEASAVDTGTPPKEASAGDTGSPAKDSGAAEASASSDSGAE